MPTSSRSGEAHDRDERAAEQADDEMWMPQGLSCREVERAVVVDRRGQRVEACRVLGEG